MGSVLSSMLCNTPAGNRELYMLNGCFNVEAAHMLCVHGSVC